MQDIGYLIGVLCAIGAGIFNNLGTVVQKKVVNELPKGEKVGRNLLKNPLWLFGLVLQLVLGTILFLFAYDIVPEWGIGIGPALVPGLMAAGLIVLALGSVKILGEKLKWQEYAGILLMIAAITLLGFSKLESDVTEAHLADPAFILRLSIFTIVLFLSALFCEILQRRKEKYRGIYYAVFSGFMFSLSNFWVAPLITLMALAFGGQYILFFIIAIVILLAVNVLGIFKIQQSFQHGQAANLIPIQQVPIQITPIFVYFAIFLLTPPTILSLPFMIGGIALIIISSFLLAKRQAQLEEIK
ncbi:MAG TPA: hypothetical protein VMV49_01965 [Candidatus Deferrimicrobium sp.]|nr:hypothetical protein [Candidatus Deferrimicrobium sp.]